MLDHILQEYKVTHILALAAQAGVRYATKDPTSYVASNVAGDFCWGYWGWGGWGGPLISFSGVNSLLNFGGVF